MFPDVVGDSDYQWELLFPSILLPLSRRVYLHRLYYLLGGKIPFPSEAIHFEPPAQHYHQGCA